MKYLLLPCLLILLIACGSCKKSASSILPPSSYKMTATITKSGNSTFFSASGNSYVTAANGNNECKISASAVSGTSVISNFTFSISGYSGVGSYVFDSIYAPVADYETITPAFIQTAFAYAIVSITSVSYEDVYGTFAGTLTDGSVITDGKFIASGTGF